MGFILTVWVGVQSMTETQSLRSILNHFNSTRNVYVDPVAKQRARDYIMKSFMDHGLQTWTEEFSSNQEKVNAQLVSCSLPGKANELENKQVFFASSCSCSDARKTSSILTTLTRDIQCEKFIKDASVSHQLQCILLSYYLFLYLPNKFPYLWFQE